LTRFGWFYAIVLNLVVLLFCSEPETPKFSNKIAEADSISEALADGNNNNTTAKGVCTSDPCSTYSTAAIATTENVSQSWSSPLISISSGPEQDSPDGSSKNSSFSFSSPGSESRPGLGMVDSVDSAESDRDIRSYCSSNSANAVSDKDGLLRLVEPCFARQPAAVMQS